MTPADAAAFEAIVRSAAAEDPSWIRRCRSVPRRHRLSRLAWGVVRVFSGVSRMAPDVVWPLHHWY